MTKAKVSGISTAKQISAKRISRPKVNSADDGIPDTASGPLQAAYSSNSAVDAHFVKGMLENSGIRCFLSNEMIAAVNPIYSFAAGGIHVLVRASDADRAGDLLRELSLPGQISSAT